MRYDTGRGVVPPEVHTNCPDVRYQDDVNQVLCITHLILKSGHFFL